MRNKVSKTNNNENITVSFPLYLVVAIAIILTVVVLIFTMFYKLVFGEDGIMKLRKVKIACSESVIDVGERVALNVENMDEGIYLESSDPQVISVVGNDILGISEGEADIYAISEEGIRSNIVTIRCIVKLKEIILNEEEIEVRIGEQKELLAKANPINATNRSFKGKSLDENIATFKGSIVTGIAVGETYVKVYEEETSIEKLCKVIVKPIEVEKIELDETSVKLAVGQQYRLMETVLPENATDKTVEWTTSNKNVITIGEEGEINAVGEGNATITVRAKNGVKVECKIRVTQSVPEKTVKYVSTPFNVRTRPNSDSKLICSVEVNDELEILKEENDWAKVRVKKNGLVGYTILKAYSSSKRFLIKGVPFLNQNVFGYPTGCEAVSATMAAKFSGYNVDIETIVNNTPTDELGKRQETRMHEESSEILNEETGQIENIVTTVEETIWVGENPFRYFVGHPRNGYGQGSYGCFAEPIATALRNCGIPCTNISGCSIDTLYSYIEQGKPVIVWCRKNAQDLTQGVTWKYPDGSGEFVELVGEHCAVLIGYDGDYVYLNDPAAGEGVNQPRAKFEENWYKLYSQAIIIN